VNDASILATGELCEALLASDRFAEVVAQYEQSIAADFLATKQDDTKKREELYASLWGARGLLEFMKLHANASVAIKQPKPPVTTEDFNDYDYGVDEPRDEQDEFYS
jgi:hypothetical protein